MSEPLNPYQSPGAAGELAVADRSPVDRVFLVGWPVVFALNLIVPLSLGWSMVNAPGRVGLGAAVLLLLGLGWYYGLRRPRLGRRVVVGAVPVAVSQLLPMLHMVLGIVCIGLVSTIGLADGAAEGPGPNLGALSGFLVTLLVGGGLLACSAFAGAVLALMLPKPLFDPAKD